MRIKISVLFFWGAATATILFGLAAVPRVVLAQAPQTLNGTFVLRQADLDADCNFSDAPETNGMFILTLDSAQATASGSLTGAGSGNRDLSCTSSTPAVTAQMDWEQNYSAQFSGTFDPATGQIAMTGTLDGNNNVSWHDCTSGSQVAACSSVGVSNYSQPYSFPVTLSGTYDQANNSANGTWTVSPITRPTNGEWTVTGPPPTLQPTTAVTANPLPPPLTATPPVTAAPGDIFVSDDFGRANAEPCTLGLANNALGGSRQLYLLPIFPSGPEPTPLGANLVSGALENNGLDYGGFQFAEADACQSPRGVIRGANLGQDLNIRADLRVPSNAGGLITQAGPYARSRAAAYADGIIGGDSAGYWVQLESTGEVKIKRLNPAAQIASSGIPASFDPNSVHTLELAIGGDRLQVALDGKLQTFMQDDQLVTVVAAPATGGSNDGTAGIAFAAEPNRGQIGGQRADNVIVMGYRTLDDLPIQNNFGASSQPTATGAASATSQATAGLPTPSGVATVPAQGALPAPTLAANVLRGDCNSDTKLTEVDALCALQMSVQLIAVNLVMDVDNNGTIDSRDAVLILKGAVGN